MKIKDGFILRQVAGSSIVVPIGKKAVDFNGMINLNDTGAFLWACLEKDITTDELIKLMINEYDVTYEQAKTDIGKFVVKLKDADLLE
ncbi:MAG: PqqD family protein [Bacillota bacterium]|nr:PqqD family protein [Bacillota bacterium]